MTRESTPLAAARDGASDPPGTRGVPWIRARARPTTHADATRSNDERPNAPTGNKFSDRFIERDTRERDALRVLTFTNHHHDDDDVLQWRRRDDDDDGEQPSGEVVRDVRGDPGGG